MKTKKKSVVRRIGSFIGVIVMLAVAVALTAVICLRVFRYIDDMKAPDPVQETEQTETVPVTTEENKDDNGTAPEPALSFAPHSVEGTEPSGLIDATAVQVDNVITSTYTAAAGQEISFEEGAVYTEAEGIITFRGNNFRDNASYGTADISEKKFGGHWQMATGSLTAPNGQVWSGSGWTGQPLVIRWSDETKQNMNMYDWAKEKAGLVEVVYPAMDGYVYFLDMETGEKTRDSLNVGYTFKGCGSLDPRGYPVLYVGSGYDSKKGTSRVFVISLIDGSIMHEFGNSDSFALRKISYFDSSPLVDADTDQLIYPGENGVLYIIKLNSAYDKEKGTFSISPDKAVKWRYDSTRNGSKFWLGCEDSAVIWKEHLIVADNGGNLMCLNLNTLQLDWAQDVLDDTNTSPVLELEDGHAYVYIGTSFHAGWRAKENATAAVPVWKIDAETGKIVWQTDYECYTVDELSGGIQGTVAVGKNDLSDLVFVPVARTGNGSGGVLAALNKATGELVWEFRTVTYSWSSPTLVYTQDGTGYVVHCNTGGYVYLLDGKTGTLLDNMYLKGTIEASPVVYGNTVVLGNRTSGIWGIELK